MRTCRTCSIEKPIDDFILSWNNIRQKHYRMTKCKPCYAKTKRESPNQKEQNRRSKAARYATEEGRSAILDAQFKWRYGITRADRDEILASQGGCCAICKTTEPNGHGGWWHMDHDHACCPEKRKKTCGKCLRGVLCSKCNLMLGHADDDIARMLAGVEYIKQYQPALASLTAGGEASMSTRTQRNRVI